MTLRWSSCSLSTICRERCQSLPLLGVLLDLRLRLVSGALSDAIIVVCMYFKDDHETAAFRFVFMEVRSLSTVGKFDASCHRNQGNMTCADAGAIQSTTSRIPVPPPPLHPACPSLRSTPETSHSSCTDTVGESRTGASRRIIRPDPNPNLGCNVLTGCACPAFQWTGTHVTQQSSKFECNYDCKLSIALSYVS